VEERGLLSKNQKSLRRQEWEQLAEEDWYDESERYGPMSSFFADEWIVGEPVMVKSGKEATVYRCQAHPRTGYDWLAAKVYRPRQSRSFKRDNVYQEGRTTLVARVDRAIAKRTKFGLEAQFQQWIGVEHATLRVLHGAGADVPKPLAFAESAMLMEYLGDGDGPAPHLHSITFDPEQAHYHFYRLLRNVTLWLYHDRIHGDLSGYNVLYWNDRATVIDFPQAIDPQANPAALELLERDIANIHAVFAGYDVPADPIRIARSLWERYRRDTLRPDPL
jgi:RIO kinase 1